MNKNIVVPIIAGLVVTSLFGILAWTCSGYQYEEVKNFPIYKATLPFGIIQYQEIGKGSFLLGSGTFMSSGGSKEIYYIKYMEGNLLKSLELQATSNALVVDGTFVVERHIIYFKTNLGQPTVRSLTYTVHIPKLPLVNQTWTMYWILLTK